MFLLSCSMLFGFHFHQLSFRFAICLSPLFFIWDTVWVYYHRVYESKIAEYLDRCRFVQLFSDCATFLFMTAGVERAEFHPMIWVGWAVMWDGRIYRTREHSTSPSHALLITVSDRSILVWGFSHQGLASFKIKDPVQLREMYTKNRRFKVDIICLLPLETLSSLTFCEYTIFVIYEVQNSGNKEQEIFFRPMIPVQLREMQ